MCIKRKLYFTYSKSYTNTSMDLRFSARGAVVVLPVHKQLLWTHGIKKILEVLCLRRICLYWPCSCCYVVFS